MSALTPFGTDLWITSGDVIDVAGFHYPTRMAVIRLGDGGLVLWSPVRRTQALAAAVAALGPVRHLVAPNAFHHLHLADWIAACPEAQVHPALNLRKRRKDIAFGPDLTDVAPTAWEGQIDQVVIGGNLIVTEVAFFHRASRTVLFTDLLQQFPASAFSGWRLRVAKADLMVGSEPAVPRKFRLAFVRRGVARAAIRRVLDWPADKVIVAHGAPVTEQGQAFLARAFHWLTG